MREPVGSSAFSTVDAKTDEVRAEIGQIRKRPVGALLAVLVDKVGRVVGRAEALRQLELGARGM